MKKVVVDASEVVKWFVPEIHSEPAAGMLDLDPILFAPREIELRPVSQPRSTFSHHP